VCAGAAVVLMLAFAPIAAAQSFRDFRVPEPLPNGSVLVIGFLGGFEKWDDPHRGVRKVALNLRSLHLPGVYAETIENHRRGLALRLIECSVKSDDRSRIILYGQSWGGAAVISTAKDLQALGLHVVLTVQVDSVGLRDDVVPANVLNAANIFQRDPFGIEGRQMIRAEDPGATRIIENVRLSYLLRPYSTLNSDVSWARRTFGGSHAKMEADQAVWAHVEGLILRAIKD
jgi:hypothetical protein